MSSLKASYTPRSLIGPAFSIAVSFGLAYAVHWFEMKRQKKQLEARRLEERKGRIKAEIKLRSQVKGDQSTKELSIQVIGKVRSPFTKRMGTPRQPQLVPAARGIIEFTVPPAALEGITEYSHAWVIFGFHANTNVENKRTKIRPPRAPHKVGQLSTRSPHRPNPIGLSLVTVDKLVNSSLYISGLDLVNNTPVYDIKPCVPWDIPNIPLRTPSWVSQDDAMSEVAFSQGAIQSLQTILDEGKRLSPFYNTLEDAKEVISQVLAQDPRSSHKGIKSNQRGTDSKEDYSFVFTKCKISFQVTDSKAIVTQVEGIDFDEESYVEGIPIYGL